MFPIFNKWQNVIYSFNGKAEFSESLLHSVLSHYPSEIILICYLLLKTYLLLSS